MLMNDRIMFNRHFQRIHLTKPLHKVHVKANVGTLYFKPHHKLTAVCEQTPTVRQVPLPLSKRSHIVHIFIPTLYSCFSKPVWEKSFYTNKNCADNYEKKKTNVTVLFLLSRSL